MFVANVLNVDSELSYTRPMPAWASTRLWRDGLTATAITIKTAITSTSTATPSGAASSADTREGKVHLLLRQEERCECVATATNQVLHPRI